MIKCFDQSYKSLVVDILSASFDDNKSINYIIKQDSKRGQRLRRLMTYCFEVCCEKGDVFISEDKQACALILHSEKRLNLIKQVQLDLQLAFQSIGIFRSNKVLKREKLLKVHQPRESFYYLWFIGVYPEKQGVGIGSKLLDEILKYYEGNRRPFYLETSVLSNLPWYEKYGFQIINEIDIGYKLFQMIRN